MGEMPWAMSHGLLLLWAMHGVCGWAKGRKGKSVMG